MRTLGVYQPGDSVLHRLPAGVKLAALVVAGVGSLAVDSPATVGVALALVAVLYTLARIPWRLALAQVRPLLWVGVALAGFHLLLHGWARAVVVVGVIATLVLLASLVTLTTRTQALVDVVVAVARPLQPLGVRPERVGLLLALGIRSVPVVVGLAEEIRDAQWSRGLTASPRAFAVPLVVRSLRHADRLGDALVARGADD